MLVLVLVNHPLEDSVLKFKKTKLALQLLLQSFGLYIIIIHGTCSSVRKLTIRYSYKFEQETTTRLKPKQLRVTLVRLLTSDENQEGLR